MDHRLLFYQDFLHAVQVGQPLLSVGLGCLAPMEFVVLEIAESAIVCPTYGDDVIGRESAHRGGNRPAAQRAQIQIEVPVDEALIDPCRVVEADDLRVDSHLGEVRLHEFRDVEILREERRMLDRRMESPAITPDGIAGLVQEGLRHARVVGNLFHTGIVPPGVKRRVHDLTRGRHGAPEIDQIRDPFPIDGIGERSAHRDVLEHLLSVVEPQADRVPTRHAVEGSLLPRRRIQSLHIGGC